MKQMTLKAAVAVMAVGLAGMLTGCAPDISPLNYSTDQTGIAAQTARGVVVAATPVKVSGGRGLTSNVGTLAGAVAGAAGGSAIGGGTRMNVLGGVGGAVLGGVLGNMAESKLTEQTGMQYEVRLANRSVVTVTQGMNPPFGVGQHVFVIFSNPARIVADPNGR